MTKIIGFDPTHERNDSHFQFMTEFCDVVNSSGAGALKIEPQFAAFTAFYNREDEALKKIPASAFTPKIHEADAARDETLTGMYELVKAMCKHFTPAVRDAALRVKVVLDAYKHIKSKSINEETSAVYNLVQELKTAKYAADVALIGATAWVNETERRNNNVETLVKNRFNENASKTDIVLRDARREVDAVFHTICDIINVYVILEGPAAYEGFIRTLNEVIKKYAATPHRRHRKGTDAADTEEPGDAAGGSEEGGAEE